MSSHHAQREFALQVVRQIRDAGYQALWAGGCVRDLLLEKTPKDYDVATDAHPSMIRTIFGKRRTLAIGESFGVIVVLGPKEAGQIEVATFRTEGPYLDGRHPEQVAFCSAEEDAKRRDFTINGMFYDPISETVLDYVGGKTDLESRIVRAIGNPQERMTEDKLRMLRAVRFAATLDFQLDVETADAVRSMAAEIQVVSAERIAQEFRRMLAHTNCHHAMRIAHDVELLQVILPELSTMSSDDWSHTLTALQMLENPTFETAAACLLALIPDCVPDICERLKLSNDEAELILWLVNHLAQVAVVESFSLAQLKRLLSHKWIQQLLRVQTARFQAMNESLAPVEFCKEFLESHSAEEINPPPLLTGNDLIAHGFTPGPRFGLLLEAVRDAQLNLTIQTQEEAFALVDELQEK